jgi:hypothetical protein
MTAATNVDPYIQAVADADNRWRELRKTLERRIREEMEEEIEAARVFRCIKAAEAQAAGRPVTRISKEGLHTTATITAYNAIREGQAYLAKESADAIAQDARPEFETAGAGRFIVTPKAADIDPILDALSMSRETFDANPELQSAEFSYDAKSGLWRAETAAFVPSIGRHPVVALSQHAPYATRIQTWVQGASFAARKAA